MSDAWRPAQYERFREERTRPFEDLLAMVEPVAGLSVIDLGCGTGELTRRIAERLPGATVRGIDRSEAMLAGAPPMCSRGDIADIHDFSPWSLVFSNAALQWVPGHEPLFARMFSTLRPGAQVAVQMPRNEEHPSHRVTAEVAGTEPFREWLGGYVRRSDALSLERYAVLFDEHGFAATCLERVYLHRLARSEEVVEWVKGTLLTAYLSRLDAEQGAVFLDAYRARLLAELGDVAPYRYPFRRMFLHGRKA